LSQTLNKKVKLSVQKDASLLSGYKVTVGGWTLDDSAQFHLNKIKEDISKRGI
jgi:F0F1-type ATP synthase delta subunit